MFRGGSSGDGNQCEVCGKIEQNFIDLCDECAQTLISSIDPTQADLMQSDPTQSDLTLIDTAEKTAQQRIHLLDKELEDLAAAQEESLETNPQFLFEMDLARKRSLEDMENMRCKKEEKRVSVFKICLKKRDWNRSNSLLIKHGNLLLNIFWARLVKICTYCKNDDSITSRCRHLSPHEWTIFLKFSHISKDIRDMVWNWMTSFKIGPIALSCKICPTNGSCNIGMMAKLKKSAETFKSHQFRWFWENEISFLHANSFTHYYAFSLKWYKIFKKIVCETTSKKLTVYEFSCHRKLRPISS
jgi:hypothetical protein